MKVLVIRVHRGELKAEGKVFSTIGPGISVFVGLEKEDTREGLITMAEKVVALRIFEDERGKMNFSVKDKKYDILCIPNFTLCADTEGGRRPSFDNAMKPQGAKNMYDEFVELLKSYTIEVKTGIFGAHMDIQLDLDGPVNIILQAK
ncbi:MAG: D-tyrosyl-tRNA(Tyr) deacylase [Candidatus Omnitrophica bacterium]|nr:D-tyrosyl-tRNA(Tyr) deacylase [Candidatus Omnitrophota bacterium]